VNFLITTLLLLITSCSSIPQTLNTETIYKKDLKFWVNKKLISGVGVVPRAIAYDIYIEKEKGKIDLLTLTTCHRSIQISEEGSKASYQLMPSEIEASSGCPLDLGAYDAKGRHAWGYLLFESDKLRLPAKILCNGDVTISQGASICQSQIGTIQKLIFSNSVKALASDGCKIEKVGTDFEYEMTKNFCYYAFIDDNGLVHDHTAFGYEQFIIRD